MRHGSHGNQGPTTRQQGPTPAKAGQGARPVLVFTRGALVGYIVALIGHGTSFWWLLGFRYVLLFLIGVELWFEPSIRKLRWVSCPALLLAAVWFTIAVLFSPASLDLVAYSPPGDYPSGTPVGRIPWDPHFADLRLAITNPSAANFQGLDILLKPSGWVHQASILDTTPGCSIVPELGGNLITMATATKSGKLTVMATPVGTGFDVYDTGGSVYTTIATDSGYRLRCDQFPSHYSVKIIFAVVAALPVLAPLMPGPKPGQLGMSVAELSGVKRPSDVFGPKPSPKDILVRGEYKRDIKMVGIRAQSIDRVLKVEATAGN